MRYYSELKDAEKSALMVLIAEELEKKPAYNENLLILLCGKIQQLLNDVDVIMSIHSILPLLKEKRPEINRIFNRSFSQDYSWKEFLYWFSRRPMYNNLWSDPEV